MQENLLDDEMDQRIALVPASKEKRLANFVLDYIGIIFFVAIFYLLIEGLGYQVNTSEDPLQERIQGMIFYITYYLLVEGITGGQTLGKMVTKTRVVTQMGHPPEVMDIIARSFLRLVPFEPFSFLGHQPSGWHDRWSKTMVIDEERSSLPTNDDWQA